jgi:hypothetical protein
VGVGVAVGVAVGVGVGPIAVTVTSSTSITARPLMPMPPEGKLASVAVAIRTPSISAVRPVPARSISNVCQVAVL